MTEDNNIEEKNTLNTKSTDTLDTSNLVDAEYIDTSENQNNDTSNNHAISPVNINSDISKTDAILSDGDEKKTIIKRDKIPGYPNLDNGNPNWYPGMKAPNPKGRKTKAETLLDLLKDELSKVDPKTGLTNEQLMTQKLMQLALAGDRRAIELYHDRIMGKPKQTTVFETPDETTVSISFGGKKTEPENTPEDN